MPNTKQPAARRIKRSFDKMERDGVIEKDNPLRFPTKENKTPSRYSTVGVVQTNEQRRRLETVVGSGGGGIIDPSAIERDKKIAIMKQKLSSAIFGNRSK